MIKVIIIDDERAGRELIKQYITNYKEFVVLAEANNGVDAVKVIQEFKPDLIFLDVQMPGMTGFDVISHLDEIPRIIFSTAYDQYAIKGFELNAVDYLLKPYTKERFNRSIERFLQSNTQLDSISGLLQDFLPKKEDYPERILVSHKNKLVQIICEEIQWIEAFGDYSKIHLMEQTYLSNYSLKDIEERLNPKYFLRVHRSSMINLLQVQEIKKLGNRFLVTLNSNQEVSVSRNHADKIKEMIF